MMRVADYRLIYPRRVSCVRAAELVASEGRQGDKASIGQCYQVRVMRNRMAWLETREERRENRIELPSSGGSNLGDKTENLRETTLV